MNRAHINRHHPYAFRWSPQRGEVFPVRIVDCPPAGSLTVQRVVGDVDIGDPIRCSATSLLMTWSQWQEKSPDILREEAHRDRVVAERRGNNLSIALELSAMLGVKVTPRFEKAEVTEFVIAGPAAAALAEHHRTRKVR